MHEDFANMKTIGAIYGKTSHQVGRELRDCGYRDQDMVGLWPREWRPCGEMKPIANGLPLCGIKPRSANSWKILGG